MSYLFLCLSIACFCLGSVYAFISPYYHPSSNIRDIAQYCSNKKISNYKGGENAVMPKRNDNIFEIGKEDSIVCINEQLQLDRYNVVKGIQVLSATSVLLSLFSSLPSTISAVSAIETKTPENTSKTNENNSNKYTDNSNGFSIQIPSSFSTMPRKKTSSSSLETGQPVEILLVAQDFLKGASLSVVSGR